MVLVGHSMGGLLSRMQAIDPGDKLWDAMLSKPPQELNVSDSVRQRLVSTLKFKPQPEVKRLVFITTPHRGSDCRQQEHRAPPLLAHPPALGHAASCRGSCSPATPTRSRPQIRDWGIYAFLSLGMLSDKHPFYQGLNAVPILVKHHSIIGRLGNGSTAPRLRRRRALLERASRHGGLGEDRALLAWLRGEARGRAGGHARAQGASS
jgi:hypothetical protein